MWEVSFESPHAFDQGRDQNSDILYFYAVSTALPSHMVTRISRKYIGKGYDYAGPDSSPRQFRVTFWDNQDLDVYHYFQRWMYIIQDPRSKRQVNPAIYQRNATLQLKDTSDLLTVETFKFKYCFPFEISEATLSYESSEVLTFDVMFSFEERDSGRGA